MGRSAAWSVTADTALSRACPPTLRVAIDNLAFAVPEGTGEEFVETGTAPIGLNERLDLSGSFAARWNEAGQEICSATSSSVVKDIERPRFAASSAVRPQAFSGDEAARLMALMGASVKNMHLMVEGSRHRRKSCSLLRLQRMGVSPDEARRQMGMMSQMMLAGVLGAGRRRRALAEAVGQFLENPGELRVCC